MTQKQNAKTSLIGCLALVLLSTVPPAFAQEAQGETKAAPAATPAEKAKSDSAAKGGGHSHPPAAREHYNRGVELHRSGYLNKAILEYKEAINADENMEPAYSNLGLVYTAQKSWSKALEAFDKALTMKPDRTTSLNGLGTVLYAMKRNDEAMEKWKKAIEIDPNFASAYYNMGNAYETQEKNRDALLAYVKASDINPKMADAYYRMGSLMNKTKHGPQAAVLLQKAVKLAPDAEFARDAKRQIETLEKQFEKDGAEYSASSQQTSDDRTAGDTKPKAVATGNSTDKATDKKKLIKNPFKKSGDSKEDKNVNMFVQPPSGEADLRSKDTE
ncbi:tetratricopeptide repeat protein [Candidatus Obscuribacterales bacterium]|nr:tetratricopeptide repeat protein [Candidatus Obscuribacterales bacterium]MBX3135914.1 tetratricopeptide repeat protein [Candidatus Obscuribacterales bacterium]